MIRALTISGKNPVNYKVPDVFCPLLQYLYIATTPPNTQMYPANSNMYAAMEAILDSLTSWFVRNLMAYYTNQINEQELFRRIHENLVSNPNKL